jgi:hypothetical protein
MSVDRRTARLWVTGLVIGLAVLVGAATLLAMPYSRKPVDEYVARVKASGGAVTVRDVIGPDPAPETNGAADVASAGKWMDEHKGDPDTWKVVGPWTERKSGGWYDGLNDEERRDFDAFFADSKPFFDGLAQGLAKPRLRDSGPAGPRANIDVMPRVRVKNVLAARAVAATAPADRLDATELLAKLGARSESRTVIEEFVASTAMDDATLAVRLALARGDVDASAWRARLDGLLAEPWLPRFRDAVRLHRGYLLELVQTVDFNHPVAFESAAERSQPPAKVALNRIVERIKAIRDGETAPPNSPADLARALAATEPFERSATDSYPRLAAEIAAAAPPTPSGNGTMRGAGRDVVLSLFDRIARMLATTETNCRLARVALAASEHRAKHGEFPASLDELKDAFGGDVPLDPFTDAPFVYEKTTTGVVISSRGRLAGGPSLDESLEAKGFVWRLAR